MSTKMQCETVPDVITFKGTIKTPEQIKTEDGRDFSKRLTFIRADNYGCGFYRCVRPTGKLQETTNWDVDCRDGLKVSMNDLELLNRNTIVQRHTGYDSLKPRIDILHSRGLKIYYEVDDDFWHLHKRNPVYPVYSGIHLTNMEKIMSCCDGTIVSTPGLMKLLSKFNSNIYLMENKVKFPDVSKRMEKPDGKIRIIYAGSSSHMSDWTSESFATEAVNRIMSRYKNVEFYFMGLVPKQFRAKVNIPGSRMFEIKWASVEDYLDHLNTFNFDIGLAVLQKSKFNDAKSNLKWLEYSACDVAFIGSSSEEYDRTIVDGETGMIVSKFSHWMDKLELLINDTNLRNTIVKNAKEVVYDKYNYDKEDDYYKNFYAQLFGF